jgi:hypothetical protein
MMHGDFSGRRIGQVGIGDRLQVFEVGLVTADVAVLTRRPGIGDTSNVALGLTHHVFAARAMALLTPDPCQVPVRGVRGIVATGLVITYGVAGCARAGGKITALNVVEIFPVSVAGLVISRAIFIMNLDVAHQTGAIAYKGGVGHLPTGRLGRIIPNHVRVRSPTV